MKSELVQKIFEMGFDFDSAANALSWTNNHFQSAVTMLIDNPDKCKAPKPATPVAVVAKRMQFFKCASLIEFPAKVSLSESHFVPTKSEEKETGFLIRLLSIMVQKKAPRT